MGAGAWRARTCWLLVTVVLIAEVLTSLPRYAKGTETSDQMAELRSLGCERGQGYLYAKPLPADGLTAALSARQAA